MPTCPRCGATYQAEDEPCTACAAACQRRSATRVVVLVVILIAMFACAVVLAYGIFSGVIYGLPT